MPRPHCVVLLGLSIASVRSANYVDPDSWAGWTQRLGLSFSDDCQEHAGLVAMWAWASSWISGRQGKQRSGHCETRSMSCPAGLAVTGIGVRSGRNRKSGSRELYDFRLRCGEDGSLTDWMGLRFDAKADDHGAGVCPEGDLLTGVQVMRGRGGGRDYYNFKLRCNKLWKSVVGLPFDSPRETRSATCARGSYVVGVRVHRGYQDWGSLDTYEFQLKCEDAESLEEKKAQGLMSSVFAELLATLGAEDAWQMAAAVGAQDSREL